MRVDEFDFDLPDTCIALEPVRPRDLAKLLHVNNEKLSDNLVRDLPDLCAPGDLIIVNDTKVLPAQLSGVRKARDTRGRDVQMDVTLHKDISHDAKFPRIWRSFVRPAKRLSVGDIIQFSDCFVAQVIERMGAEAILSFALSSQDFIQHLKLSGVPPLPPYIARKRALTEQDRDDYQTHYARCEGSVAAPTAGLHFTSELLDALKAKNIEIGAVTLHVGAGTFLPISVDDTDDHQMHAEWGEITRACADQINQVRMRGGRILAVGTTALRLLESAADDGGVVRPFLGETDIFITPGYKFKIVDRLLTNFHLPRSTLFMLVSAFAGVEVMKNAYAQAIKNNYRFYSYGDASLLEQEKC